MNPLNPLNPLPTFGVGMPGEHSLDIIVRSLTSIVTSVEVVDRCIAADVAFNKYITDY